MVTFEGKIVGNNTYCKSRVLFISKSKHGLQRYDILAIDGTILYNPDILFTCTLYLLGIYAIYFDLKVPSRELSYTTCGTGKLMFPATMKGGHV